MRNKFIKNFLISNALFQHRVIQQRKKRRSKSAILTSKKTKQRKVKINQKNNQKSTEKAKKSVCWKGNRNKIKSSRLTHVAS